MCCPYHGYEVIHLPGARPFIKNWLPFTEKSSVVTAPRLEWRLMSPSHPTIYLYLDRSHVGNYSWTAKSSPQDFTHVIRQAHIYVEACYLHSRPVTWEYTLLSCSSEELRSKEVLKPAQGQSQSPQAGFARQRSSHSPSVSWTGRCQFRHRLYCIKGYLVSWWGIISGGLMRGVHLPYCGQSPSRRLDV